MQTIDSFELDRPAGVGTGISSPVKNLFDKWVCFSGLSGDTVTILGSAGSSGFEATSVAAVTTDGWYEIPECVERIALQVNVAGAMSFRTTVMARTSAG